MSGAVMFSKASDEWATPYGVWHLIDEEFGFDIDAAATTENAKCPVYFTAERDALSFGWVEWWSTVTSGRYGEPVIWLNPPYSKCREFVAKAVEEARKGCTVVMLIPARTDTRYWHDYIWDGQTHQPRPGVEVRFIKGRLKFGDSKNSAPFPSAVVIFRPTEAEHG